MPRPAPVSKYTMNKFSGITINTLELNQPSNNLDIGSRKFILPIDPPEYTVDQLVRLILDTVDYYDIPYIIAKLENSVNDDGTVQEQLINHFEFIKRTDYQINTPPEDIYDVPTNILTGEKLIAKNINYANNSDANDMF